MVSCAVLVVSLAACDFERSPLRSEPQSQRSDPDASARVDASAAGDASRDADVDGSRLDGAPADRDASPDDDAGNPDGGGAADGSSPDDPTMRPEPTPPALQCGGTFCASSTAPAKVCCTGEADVEQRAARAADRCGLELDAVDAATFGSRCWQRDQLGILDDRCASRPASADDAIEPGCCSDGRCGTFNAEHKLGCRFASSAEPAACAGPASGQTCDPVGQYGLRIRVDSAWGGRSGGLIGLTDDGRGAVEVYVLARVAGVDPTTSALEATGRVCGVVLPPFYSTTLCESYQPQFPDAIWESTRVPHLTLGGRYACSPQGCELSIDPQTYLLGFALDNSEATWPSAGSTNMLRCAAGRGEDCYPDHDDDGVPGVRVELVKGGVARQGNNCGRGYELRAAPLNDSVASIFDGVRRTDRLLLGMRTRLGSSFRLADDCAAGRGSAIAENINSRAVGCFVEEGTFDFPNVRNEAGPNERCSGREAQFLDANLPEYLLLAPGEKPASSLELADESPSRGPEAQLVRLGSITDAIGCADVRAANY
jgi:hypothetical protein